jgi:hypothetical protein
MRLSATLNLTPTYLSPGPSPQGEGGIEGKGHWPFASSPQGERECPTGRNGSRFMIECAPAPAQGWRSILLDPAGEMRAHDALPDRCRVNRTGASSGFGRLLASCRRLAGKAAKTQPALASTRPIRHATCYPWITVASLVYYLMAGAASRHCVRASYGSVAAKRYTRGRRDSAGHRRHTDACRRIAAYQGPTCSRKEVTCAFVAAPFAFRPSPTAGDVAPSRRLRALTARADRARGLYAR